MSDKSCIYPCGCRYCSKEYSDKVLKAVESELISLSLFVNEVAELCNPNKYVPHILTDNTYVTATYVPGIPVSLSRCFPDVYNGPSLDIEVSLRYGNNRYGCNLSRSYTYMVMFDGNCGVVENFNMYDDDVDPFSKFDVDMCLAADCMFAQIPLFDFTVFKNAVDNFTSEFNK